jgi:predicted nucleic acid-binding protein
VTLRCLIDSMVFDVLATSPGRLDDVDRLTRRRELELLAAAETMRELEAIPDRTLRRRLQRVRVSVVAPVPGDARLRARLQGGGDVSDHDAGIALAAAAHHVPLVTEDRDLRAAVTAHLPEVAVWDAGELVARLEALV